MKKVNKKEKKIWSKENKYFRLAEKIPKHISPLLGEGNIEFSSKIFNYINDKKISFFKLLALLAYFLNFLCACFIISYLSKSFFQPKIINWWILELRVNFFSHYLNKGEFFRLLYYARFIDAAILFECRCSQGFWRLSFFFF